MSILLKKIGNIPLKKGSAFKKKKKLNKMNRSIINFRNNCKIKLKKGLNKIGKFSTKELKIEFSKFKSLKAVARLIKSRK